MRLCYSKKFQNEKQHQNENEKQNENECFANLTPHPSPLTPHTSSLRYLIPVPYRHHRADHHHEAADPQHIDLREYLRGKN